MPEQTYATPRASLETPSMPDNLTAAETKLVFLYLSTTGGATVKELNADLDIQKLSLFPVLNHLDSQGLISRDGDYYQVAA